MATYRSDIANALTPDPALALDANYRFNNADRAYIDDQIRATQQGLADNVLNGIHAAWFLIDSSSAAILPGQAVCAAGTTAQAVTLGTPSAIAVARAATGVALQAGAQGGKIRVALFGLVPASVTGLAASAGFARVSATTYFAELVSGLGSADYPLGAIAANGDLALCPLPVGVAGGAGAPVGPTEVLLTGGSTATATTTAAYLTHARCNNTAGVTSVTDGGLSPDGAEVRASDIVKTGTGSFGTHAFSFVPRSGEQAWNPTTGAYGSAGAAVTLQGGSLNISGVWRRYAGGSVWTFSS